MDKSSLKRNYITEKELLDIFQEQYNDLFSDILIFDQQLFLDNLKKQVMAFMEILKKYCPQNLFKKTEDIFVKKYIEEKDIVSKDYEIIQNTPKEQLEYLNKLNTIIHCPKCKDALHTCGYKFILYGNYVYCIYCMKVYNGHQVFMYCDDCDLEYYTKLREIADFNLQNYYLVSISDYHCKLDQEEKIKCPQCFKDLYADIVNPKNLENIEEIICIYCNLAFDINLFNFKCKQCTKVFKSKAKIYNEFSNKKIDLICTIHTLCSKILTGPYTLLNKDCDCNINLVKQFKHSDGGILLDGERNGQKVIICDKCFQIFDYFSFIFSCPLCNKKFKTFSEDFQKENSSEEKGDSNKGSLLEKKNVPNKSQRNNPDTSKEQYSTSNSNSMSNSNKELCSCQYPSSNKNNKKTKNMISDNPFCTKKQLLKSNNSKRKSKNDKNIKTYRESDKEMVITAKKDNNNNTLKEKDKDKDKNQNINIKIQNFYNNYAPIIHIIEKNPKNIDKNTDSKYLINRNYTLIRTSPKAKKINPNKSNSKYISNEAMLKRSITENAKFNIGMRNSTVSSKKENLTNDEREKEPNLRFKKNVLNKKKKFSASFTISSSNQNDSNVPNYPINNVPLFAESFKKGKKKFSAENDKIGNKKILCGKAKFHISTKDANIKNIGNVNTINELNEEYTNEIKQISIQKPKAILKTENCLPAKKSNKKIKRVTIASSSSLSEEKYKKMQFQGEKEKKENNNENNNANNNTNNNANNVNNTNAIEQAHKIKKMKSKPENRMKINNNKNNNNNNNDNNPINIINNNNKKNNNSNIIINKSEVLENKSTPNSSKDQKQKIIQKMNKNTKNENKPKGNIIKDFNSEDYNILSMIGEGTFSQIFLVENDKTHKKYALKKMSATKMEDLEQKKEEFELIQKLTSEDEKLNLVKIYGIQIKKLDKFNMVLYILMDAATSDWETELKNRHYSKQYYTEEELKKIMLNLVSTFASLQKKGICHRDVKPQNILCFGNGIFKITDFGEAKTSNRNYEKNTIFNFSQDTSIQTIRGTELYMSPILFNALRNSSVDDLQYNAFKSDVFSLGLCFLLSASLTYRPLSQLRDIKNMDEIKVLIEKSLKDRYSQKFIDILFIMLQLEEKDRPDFIELESIIKKKL